VRAITEAVLDNATPALAYAWHAVALSAELGEEPIRVWLLGQPWCLARTEGGRPAAWADRCPHRLAPLSAGRVAGEGIRCGYHGWRFGTDGRCTEIPATDQMPPARAAVEIPWGLDERHGVVWMAPRHPATERFDFPEWDDPAFVNGMSQAIRTSAGAGLLVDNFLDAAHFPFVHAASFGVPKAARVVDQGVRRDGWTVETVFETWYREAGEVQRQLLTKTGSASLSVNLRLTFPGSGTVIAILFCCTPERPGQTRVYKLLARNDLTADPGRLEEFIAEEDQILQEDLAILERYDHEALPLDRTVELHTRADRLSLSWRSLMADFVVAHDPSFAI
jgi:phenylpropionate dioxygenase-like ring-hydroxylating dioxygenase large terminal subunit